MPINFKFINDLLNIYVSGKCYVVLITIIDEIDMKQYRTTIFILVWKVNAVVKNAYYTGI